MPLGSTAKKASKCMSARSGCVRPPKADRIFGISSVRICRARSVRVER